MTLRTKGILVLAIQLLLVLSIAAKYAWERHTCPRVWARTMQYDPERIIRGRYIALTLRANACNMPAGTPGKDYGTMPNGEWGSITATTWTVIPAARDGKLAPILADKNRPEDTQQLTLPAGHPCKDATLSGTTEFFIAEHAKQPFPLARGEELWAEVTVPPMGPPRPVRLAISDGKNFRVLDLR